MALNRSQIFKLAFAFFALSLATLEKTPPVIAAEASSLTALAGRWVGEGRLGVKDNPPESVKCRATYFVEGGDASLKQNIRCATAGGSIEVKSEIANSAGALTGAWSETIHNLSGTLAGEMKPNGFHINVKGDGLNANMDIVVQSNKQIVEIQFFDSTLIGLTLVLDEGVDLQPASAMSGGRPFRCSLIVLDSLPGADYRARRGGASCTGRFQRWRLSASRRVPLKCK